MQRNSRQRICFRFSVKMMLFIFIPVALLAWCARWVLRSPPLDVQISPQAFSFVRYDDHAGSFPLGALVQVTNVSDATAWYFGCPAAPVVEYRECVDGEWKSRISAVDAPMVSMGRDYWVALRPLESIDIVVGPVSETASQMRVGLAFTTKRFLRTEARWVFSPVAGIVRKGACYFAEPAPGARQEEHVVSLVSPR